ncbi:MAG: ComF family protein [Clostridia bacterium]|nr:ComF family protein [Clostridia bacterium]
MKLLERLAGLLYPRRAMCMGCGSMTGCDRDDLCEDCREELAKNWIGVRGVSSRTKLDGAAFAHHYHGPAGGMVRRLKYNSVWVLAGEMGRETAKAAELLRFENIAAVTAVPMHPKRRRRRGGNHSEMIAREAAARLGFPYMELLYRTRNAPQQARLSNAERRKNLDGAFAVLPEMADTVRGGRILLIDDVWTTGSTATNCAKALRAAGAGRVYFAAYAFGERKRNGKNNQRKESHGAAHAGFEKCPREED